MPAVDVPLSGGMSTVDYAVTGSGPGLLLIHGTAITRAVWAPVVERVRERFTVVTPDLSGSGRTTDHGGPVTVADLAAQALAAATHAGLSEFHVAGHSLGAVAAAHLAGTSPERVRSAVLHAAWVRTDTRQDAEFRFWLDLLAHGPAAFARVLPLMTLGPAYWRTATPEGNEALIAGLAELIQPGAARHVETDRTVDLTPLLGAITAPTLVVACAHDRLIDAAQQRELLARLPAATYAELGTGHGGFGEDPDAFTGLLLDFLATRLSPAGSG